MSIQVIIGQATNVSLDGTVCAISANWGFEPGKQDAFCLGSWTPSTEHMIFKPQQTLSITLYAPGPTHSVIPSNSCDMSDTIAASVSPATCNGVIEGLSGDWMVTSYNYSKEAKDQPAQESWSLIKYIGASAYLSGQAASRAVEPSTILRGISQGQTTDTAVTGIIFDSAGAYATSVNGSVSAGAIGKSTTMQHGVVESIGGGSSSVSVQGTGSASIPLNPIYSDIT